jgi:hypothetical protein
VGKPREPIDELQFEVCEDVSVGPLRADAELRAGDDIIVIVESDEDGDLARIFEQPSPE